jgi:hypothetical protein
LINRLFSGEWQITVTDLSSSETFSSSGFDNEIVRVNNCYLTFIYSQSRSGKLSVDDILFVRKNMSPFIEKVEVMAGGLLKFFSMNLSHQRVFLFQISV